jgi:acyl dehydratase
MKYFEQIGVGDTFPVGRHTFTADDIKGFARRFDPQLFHVDEAAAEHSHFGALCASGWHTAVAWMRLMVDYRRGLAEAARARRAGCQHRPGARHSRSQMAQAGLCGRHHRVLE